MIAAASRADKNATPFRVLDRIADQVDEDRREHIRVRNHIDGRAYQAEVEVLLLRQGLEQRANLREKRPKLDGAAVGLHGTGRQAGRVPKLVERSGQRLN